MSKIERRQFLQGAAVGAGSLFLGSLFPKRAFAQATADTNRKFIVAYFEGGWDILLGLDPRDPATTNAAMHKIEPGYGQLQGGYGNRGENGLQRAQGLVFGPAVPQELLGHAGDLSIINAINMDTAAHEVGRRYFITGQFPRGIAAVGSSLSAEIISQVGEDTHIPNLALGVEAYARGLPSFATPLAVNGLTDLLVALTPFVDVDPAILSAIEGYQDNSPGCAGTKLDRDGLTTQLLQSQSRAREYIRAQLDQVFNVGREDAEMAALRDLYGLAGGGLAEGSPESVAFAAGQALKEGISQVASLTIARGLDTHSNWNQLQAPAQERGWRALAALISDLKATESKTSPGKSLFDETTILAFSEFGRTPMFNNLSGRDHFLGNSALIGGAGIKSGVTIGKSASVGMMPLDTELATGAGIAAPTEEQKSSGKVQPLSPKHVLTTVLAAAGLDYSYLRSEPITALLT